MEYWPRRSQSERKKKKQKKNSKLSLESKLLSAQRMNEPVALRNESIITTGKLHIACTQEPTLYLIWFQGDDGAQSKDKRMDILHVQVVGSHGVGNRVV